MRRPRVDPLSTHQVGPLDISPSWPIGIMYLSWGYHCFLSRWVPSLMTECLHPIWALCHGNFLGRPTVTSTWGSAGNRTRDPLHCDQVLNLLNQQNPLGGSSANSSLVGTKLQSTWPISQIPCFFCMFWSSHKALHL